MASFPFFYFFETSFQVFSTLNFQGLHGVIINLNHLVLPNPVLSHGILIVAWFITNELVNLILSNSGNKMSSS